MYIYIKEWVNTRKMRYQLCMVIDNALLMIMLTQCVTELLIKRDFFRIPSAQYID